MKNNIKIIDAPRCSGYTTYMFRAAAIDPNCYFVIRDDFSTEEMVENFIDYCVKNKIKYTSPPEFITVSNFNKKVEKYSNKNKPLPKPYIFDNSIFTPLVMICVTESNFLNSKQRGLFLF